MMHVFQRISSFKFRHLLMHTTPSPIIISITQYAYEMTQSITANATAGTFNRFKN